MVRIDKGKLKIISNGLVLPTSFINHSLIELLSTHPRIILAQVWVFWKGSWSQFFFEKERVFFRTMYTVLGRKYSPNKQLEGTLTRFLSFLDFPFQFLPNACDLVYQIISCITKLGRACFCDSLAKQKKIFQRQDDPFSMHSSIYPLTYFLLVM